MIFGPPAAKSWRRVCLEANLELLIAVHLV